MKNKLVLASASSRRLALLHQIDLHPLHLQAADIDETPLKLEKPEQMASRLARAKASKISQNHPSHFILGADTVVACGRRVLPKADDEKHARACLTLLSGRRHHVYGGIAVITADGKIIERVCDTRVQFKTLTRQEIDAYIQSGEWEGKAGGYAIQGRAAGFVKSIQGSYSNVVGLSLYDTLQMLTGGGYFRQ